MAGFRLGIDMGTNSIGWCLFRLAEHGSPIGIEALGVRIFSDGRNPQSDTSLAVDRRNARSARRRRDRFLDRRDDLMKALVRHGLMPADATERKALEMLDPYELRAKGLHEKLHPHHLGRAIFHLNQRRGFKSNRRTNKAQKNDDVKGMKGGIVKLNEAMVASGTRTLGEYLYVKRRKGRSVRGWDGKDGKQTEKVLPVRARPTVVKNKNEYEFYPDRAMYEREFDLLWQQQRDLGAPLTEAARAELRDIILYQRPLAKIIPGKCALDPTDQRAPLALPSVQLFRIMQEVNNLQTVDLHQKRQPLRREQRETVIAMLRGETKVSFDKIRRKLKIPAELAFNLESEKRDHLKGDETAVKLGDEDCFGTKWARFDLATQDAIVERLLDDPDEQSVRDWLMAEHGLDEAAAQAVADTSLADGFGRVGRRAIAAMLPAMLNDGAIYAEAARAAGYHHSDRRPDEVFDDLPYYGQVLDRHTGKSSGDPQHDAEKRYGRIANPTVHIGLNQLRKIVNAIIGTWGRPQEIVVEVARDLKLSQKQKDELAKDQKKNQDANDKRREKLRELGLKENGENMLRLRLWEELNPGEPQNRRCPYTGRLISAEKLFSDEIEVEHILPFRRTLDNSPANKTVSFRAANRLKGNLSPHEAFGNNQHGYDWADIEARARDMPKNKRWRFADDAMTKLEGEKDFLARQLVDTQYLARATHEYLAALYTPDEGSRVWVTPGRLTEMMRGKWGLNRLLSDHNLKNRYDHRHHAIDAFVIGLTDRGLLNRIAAAADQHRDRLIEEMPEPWEGFREQLGAKLDAMIVSHKPDHGVQGKLHEETAYGIIADPTKEDGATLVFRKPLAGLTPGEVERIRDRKLRKDVMEAVAGLEGDKKAFGAALAKFTEARGTKRARLIKNEEGFIALKDESSREYKGLIAGDNHRIEILQLPTGKWVGRGISVFAANQKRLDSHREDDAKPVMTVHKGDLLRIEHDGAVRTMRVVRLRVVAQQLMMAEHHESGNLPERLKEGTFKWCNVSINQLAARNARPVYADVLGRIHDPGPPK